MTSPYGKLYLIPTTLGDTAPLEVLPISVKKIVEQVDVYIVENEKTARRFIKQIKPSKKQASLEIFLLNKFTDPSELPGFLEPCLQGKHVGLLSEAGCPAIADPGADVVMLAHKQNIQVVPLVGPSSIVMAHMSSGMNGQSFAFNGYLPIDKNDKKQALKNFERLSQDKNQSQLFIETPYRNNQLMEEMTQILHPNTLLCVACDLTLPTEIMLTKPISFWKKHKIDLHKRPCIFIVHKN